MRRKPALGARPERYLVFGRPEILEEEIEEVAATLRSGWLGTGPRVAAFEREFAAYVGSAHAVAVSSCTAALHLALHQLGLEPGDEVIVPALTFAATANVVVHARAKPVFADVEVDSMCLDPADVARRITPRTRAVVPVHFAGRACNMDRLLPLAEAHGLAVVEDCAHAIETLHRGRHAGTLGHFGAFSFYATKNVTCGEGGMLVTPAPESAARARRLSLHGLDADAWARSTAPGVRHHEVLEAGFKCNMMDLQAAIALPQLRRVERNLERREAIWRRYDEAFADLPVRLPAPAEEGTRHARHLYTPLLVLDALAGSRDAVRDALDELGVGTGIHYRALHLHPYYRELLGHRPGDLPVAEWIGERTLSLPLSPSLDDGDVERVIGGVRAALERLAH